MATSRTILDGGTLSGVPHPLPNGWIYVIQRSRDGYRAGILKDPLGWALDRPHDAYTYLSRWKPTRDEAVAWAEERGVAKEEA